MHSKVMHILYVFIHKFILFIYLFPPIHFWTASEMQFIIFNKVVDRVPPQTLVQSAPMYMSQLGKVNWTPCTLEIWGIFNKKKQGGDLFFLCKLINMVSVFSWSTYIAPPAPFSSLWPNVCNVWSEYKLLWNDFHTKNRNIFHHSVYLLLIFWFIFFFVYIFFLLELKPSALSWNHMLSCWILIHCM